MEPWDDPIEGKDYGAKCQQVDPGRGAMMGSEDCLFLNVFTPRIPSRADRRPPASSLVPVMVYIHGGDWMSGSGNIDPAPLVDKGVVVVSMNYRLGPLGFLNLGNQYISGNQGMKDQLLALQWVRQNIYAFGGDAERVTIFVAAALCIIAWLCRNLAGGECAETLGGASVDERGAGGPGKGCMIGFAA